MNENIHSGLVDVDQIQRVGEIHQFLDRASACPTFQQYKQQLRGFLDLQPGEILLDVGCGLGYEACWFAADQPEAHVFALDREVMIDEAARRATEAGVNVRWLVGEAEAIPLPDGSVDACLAERVLMYMSVPEQGIQEIGRVLKPGGRFASFELDYDATLLGGDEGIADHVGRLLSDSVGESRMGRKLPDLLDAAGFVEIDCQPIAFIPPREVQQTVIDNTVIDAVDRGRLPAHEVRTWLDQQAEAHDSGRFTAAFVGCVVTARMSS